MRYEVTLAGRTRAVDVRRGSRGVEVRLDDGAWEPVDVARDGVFQRLRVGDAAPVRLGVTVSGEDVFVLDGVTPLRGTVVDPRAHALDAADGAGAGRIATPMPGAIVRVPVQAGDAVLAGQVLVVVEAMKMENEFKAPFAGRVVEIAVTAGRAVEAGALLVVLEKDA